MLLGELGKFVPLAAARFVDVSWTAGSYAYEVSWSVLDAAGTSVLDGDGYTSDTQLQLPPGDYTLACYDSYGDGWNGGYVTIAGEDLCGDFEDDYSDTTFTVECTSSLPTRVSSGKTVAPPAVGVTPSAPSCAPGSLR